ncbi:MAG: ribose-phosphate pyrophosphokinase [Clostridia bacterium]|nr:ribose-phosphate pyrophosphokinase [Clostridia bacterium]
MSHGRSGDLGLIVMQNCWELGQKVDRWIRQLRGETREDATYIIPIEEIRFNNGEGKIKIKDSVRSKDIFIITDVGNYHCTYNMFGYENRMGPDEHFQDIKRVMSAIGGKANRVTLIMPLLYSSRQHKRKGRESLDCAMALEELRNTGIDTILTFDAHDPTIYNAIPGTSFENIFPTYTILKTFIGNEGGDIFKDNMIVISPDTGAMERAIYYANVLGLDVGMFYKRRDHTRIVDGKNPIVQHEYIGGPMEGKKILIIDDMVASGQSLIEVITEAKKRNAAEIYAVSTFAFFTEGVEKFDKLYEDGQLTKLYTTNLSYIPDEYLDRPWLVRTDLSKFIARITNTLHNEESISSLLDCTTKIRKLLRHYE